MWQCAVSYGLCSECSTRRGGHSTYQKRSPKSNGKYKIHDEEMQLMPPKLIKSRNQVAEGNVWNGKVVSRFVNLAARSGTLCGASLDDQTRTSLTSPPPFSSVPSASVRLASFSTRGSKSPLLTSTPASTCSICWSEFLHIFCLHIRRGYYYYLNQIDRLQVQDARSHFSNLNGIQTIVPNATP